MRASLATWSCAEKVHRQDYVLDCGERRQELKELKDEPDAATAPRRKLARIEFLDRAIVDRDRT